MVVSCYFSIKVEVVDVFVPTNFMETVDVFVPKKLNKGGKSFTFIQVVLFAAMHSLLKILNLYRLTFLN